MVSLSIYTVSLSHLKQKVPEKTPRASLYKMMIGTRIMQATPVGVKQLVV